MWPLRRTSGLPRKYVHCAGVPRGWTHSSARTMWDPLWGEPAALGPGAEALGGGPRLLHAGSTGQRVTTLRHCVPAALPFPACAGPHPAPPRGPPSREPPFPREESRSLGSAAPSGQSRPGSLSAPSPPGLGAAGDALSASTGPPPGAASHPAQKTSEGSMSRCGSRSPNFRGRPESDRPAGSGQGTRGLSKILKHGPTVWRSGGAGRGARQERGGAVLRRKRVNPKPEPQPASPESCVGGALPVGGLLGWESGAAPVLGSGPSDPCGRGAESQLSCVSPGDR